MASYPPEHHLLRDLCVASYWTGDLESRFIAPLVPEIARPDGSMGAGALFAVADLAAASTAIAGADQDTRQALHEFGLNTGIAFQIFDDVLDYTGDPEEMGKNVGDDLNEGKPTLPLIHLLQTVGRAI